VSSNQLADQQSEIEDPENHHQMRKAKSLAVSLAVEMAEDFQLHLRLLGCLWQTLSDSEMHPKLLEETGSAGFAVPTSERPSFGNWKKRLLEYESCRFKKKIMRQTAEVLEAGLKKGDDYDSQLKLGKVHLNTLRIRT
jgi:hypothetical protein